LKIKNTFEQYMKIEVDNERFPPYQQLILFCQPQNRGIR